MRCCFTFIPFIKKELGEVGTVYSFVFNSFLIYFLTFRNRYWFALTLLNITLHIEGGK